MVKYERYLQVKVTVLRLILTQLRLNDDLIQIIE
jgi:hypothetical protein